MKRFQRMALVGVGLLFLSAPAPGQQTKEMTPLDIPMIGDIEMLKVGDPAPRFTLEDIEGSLVTMTGEPSDKVYLMVFWSIFCEPCKAEMPLIQRLYEQYRDQGLEVLAVDMDGGGQLLANIKAAAKRYNLRVIIDKETDEGNFVVADPYGVAGTPTLYVVGRDGKIAFAEVGRAQKEVLEGAIQKALAAK